MVCSNMASSPVRTDVGALAAHLPTPLAEQELERLRAWVAAFEDRWPALVAPPGAGRWLGAPLTATTFDVRYPADLVLAASCLAQDRAALESFDPLVVDEVRRAVTPLQAAKTPTEDVTQAVRERLLVDGKLADYSGAGPLGAWLRAVAVRVALNAQRPQAREDAVDEVPDAPLADPDPELALLRARHRVEFKAALSQALTALTPRERTLLRLTACDGLTLAEVGKMYGKDTSTASRWVATARDTLREATRAQLAKALSLSASELESVLRAADSELHLSLARLLTDTP